MEAPNLPPSGRLRKNPSDRPKNPGGNHGANYFTSFFFACDGPMGWTWVFLDYRNHYGLSPDRPNPGESPPNKAGSEQRLSRTERSLGEKRIKNIIAIRLYVIWNTCGWLSSFPWLSPGSTPPCSPLWLLWPPVLCAASEWLQTLRMMCQIQWFIVQHEEMEYQHVI